MKALIRYFDIPAFHYPNYRYVWLSRLSFGMAMQIFVTAISWDIYLITKEALALAIIGLSQFLPSFIFILLTGSFADKYNRKKIVTIAFSVGIVLFFFIIYFLLFSFNLNAIYSLIFMLGTTRAFASPAIQAMIPNMVDKKDIKSALAFNATSWQMSMILGPLSAGILISFNSFAPYISCIIFLIISVFCLLKIKYQQKQRATSKTKGKETINELLLGIKYVVKNKILLSIISLDLVAVLFGSIRGFLPIIVQDILTANAETLGLLRAAESIGAIVCALYLARNPLNNNIGKKLLVCVFIFGITAFIMAFASSIILSFALIFTMGAADMVSVVIRNTLMQLQTPDQLRGRVNAVNMLFVGASNELGEFRAGSFAHLFGTYWAIISGCIITMATPIIWYYLFPKLAKLNNFEDIQPIDDEKIKKMLQETS